MKFRALAVLALLLCAACQNPSNHVSREVWRLSPDNGEWSGEELSSPGFSDRGWMKVSKRTTVLQSYVDAGLVPDPHFGDNVLNIPDSLFCRDFWYRNTFNVKFDTPRQFLNIDGINWKAEVWLNSEYLGRIDGAFRPEQFDVTGVLREGRNVLAVKIIHNANYGEIKPRTEYSTGLNGGILGADNPTMHPTIGWDWIPTLPGRNIGMYGDLWYKFTGNVTIEDPFVSAGIPLPDTSRAFVNAEVTLVNHSAESSGGILNGRFGPLSFSRRVVLEPESQERVCFDSLLFENPRLWWPDGYGEPYLYDVEFEFINDDGKRSDCVSFKSGVRQMDYELEDYTPVTEGIIPGGYPDRVKNKRLQMYVNGRRFIGFGGNWGYPELMLQYDDADYDAAVRYHKEMNFTMIRDWVGMTSERAFYDACDRYGIMVWQDFWLANPWDGPDPEDPEMFNETARRYIMRVRNHPCIALYVGRNEGYPPESIDTCLRSSVARLHPGLYYHPHSAADGFNGGGPYNVRPLSDYFHLYGHDEMHSERGMPAVMNYENLVRTIGENAEPYSSLEHPNFMYAMHDYTLGRKQNSAQSTETFNEMIVKAFGEPRDAREFTELAQWVNYEGYRAMFEGRSEYRQGLLLWMSHPCWPSMVWQTYDWYFEPTAAFFGCKKACEPLHILYNRWRGDIQVVNYRAGVHEGLTAYAEILDINGKRLWERSCPLSINEDETLCCFPLEVPSDITDVYFLRLRLSAPNGKLLSGNMYVLGREEGNLKALRELPEASVETLCVEKEPGSYDVRLTNTGEVPALMLRLRVNDNECLVTPVHYSDNYIHLMPGESRMLTVSFDPQDCKGAAEIAVKGFNVSDCRAQKAVAVFPFRDRSLSAEQRAADLLSRLTLEEKAALSRFDSPAIPRLGVKPYNWWNEALHGVARNGSATVFPMPIGMAASFDEDLVEQVFTAVGDEARVKHKLAADAGGEDIYNGLTFWTPNINIFRDPRWGRGMETYGEDPCLTGRMGAAVVRGLQGDLNAPVQKAHACAKHFAVHSGTESDRHRFDAEVSERDLRETYLPAFKELVDAGVREVMTAYNRFRGVPCTANGYLVDSILRREWGYDGLLVSDCWAISDFYEPGRHGYSDTRTSAAAAAAKNGLNMECGTSYRALPQAVREGLIDESVLDANLLPVLAARFRLGEMDGESPWDGLSPELVEGPEHKALSLKMAEESLVLLQNRGDVLPLPEDCKVALIGPNADYAEMQWGNYNPVPKSTVTLLDAMRDEYPGLLFERGCGHVDGLQDIDSLLDKLKGIDVVVFAGGISPMLEGEQMNVEIPGFAGGDRTDIELPAVQRRLLAALHDAGKRIVLVNFSGSAMGLVQETENCDAILQAWYPGQEGGTAIVNVLSGRVSPSGKLPVTFYRSAADLPDPEDYNMEGHTYRFFRGEPLFCFGYGLSYSSFSYGTPVVKCGRIVVPVTNTGKQDATETVQFYISRPDDPSGPVKTLRDWRRVFIPAGKTVSVSFPLDEKTFTWWSPESNKMLSLRGYYTLYCGGDSQSLQTVHDFRY